METQTQAGNGNGPGPSPGAGPKAIGPAPPSAAMGVGGGGGGGGGSSKRRDFGSHGSLDALTSGAERESFFALLRDLGAQSSSGSSNGSSSHVPSRSSPERDVDAKPVGCAPSRLAELLRPNFHRGVVSHDPLLGPNSAVGTHNILPSRLFSPFFRRNRRFFLPICRFVTSTIHLGNERPTAKCGSFLSIALASKWAPGKKK